MAEGLDGPGFEYANLAIRGRLLDPILTEQLPVALAMEPDLITIAGGVNDALRPGWDLTVMARLWEQALTATEASGADVPGHLRSAVAAFRALGRIETRLADYRQVMLDTAARHGARVVDFWYASVFDDPASGPATGCI